MHIIHGNVDIKENLLQLFKFFKNKESKESGTKKADTSRPSKELVYKLHKPINRKLQKCKVFA